MRFSGVVFLLRMRLIFQLRRSDDKWSIGALPTLFMMHSTPSASQACALDPLTPASVCHRQAQEVELHSTAAWAHAHSAVRSTFALRHADDHGAARRAGAGLPVPGCPFQIGAQVLRYDRGFLFRQYCA
jgi:hypothetical protein